MQISTSTHASNSVSKDLPVSLQSALVNGKQLEATVIARVSAETVKIKLGDTVLQIKVDPAIQVGQQVSVERQPQTGELLIKPVTTPLNTDLALNKLQPLQTGQTVAVEVIKLLADKQMLVKPLIPADKQNPSAMASKLPAQIEIDISALKQIPKIGERLALEVVREQPLSVNLRTEPPTLKEQVQRIQRDLLPLLDKPKLVTERLNNLLPRLTELPVLQKAVASLFNHIADKPQLSQPAVLYQAIQRSGVFLESQLKYVPAKADTVIKATPSEQVMQALASSSKVSPNEKTVAQTQPNSAPKVSSFFAFDDLIKASQTKTPAQSTTQTSSSQAQTNTPLQTQTSTLSKSNQNQVVRPESLQQDFKANLLRLTTLIRQQLVDVRQQPSVNSEKLYQSLPVDIRDAMQAIVKSPESLQKLPAQIQQFLTAQGRTPANLLLSLLTSSQPDSSAKPTATTGSLASQLTTALPQLMSSSQQGQSVTQQQSAQLVQMQLLRDVMRELETLSARVQSHQLQMVKDSDSPTNTNVWLFDLPVKDRQQLELLQMRFEQRLQEEEGEPVWQVQLNLETVNLGPMQAQITLHQNKVSVLLLAERVNSADLLKADLTDLEQRLDKLGVSVSHLDCRQAPIAELSKVNPDQQGDNIVNVSV